MSRRTIRTIEDAAAAMAELLTPPLEVWVSGTWFHSRSHGAASLCVMLTAGLRDEYGLVVEVNGATPAELYRKFCLALCEYLRPRRLPVATVPTATPRKQPAVARAALANGQARLSGPVGVRDRHVEAKGDVKRICGPTE